MELRTDPTAMVKGTPALARIFSLTPGGGSSRTVLGLAAAVELAGVPDPRGAAASVGLRRVHHVTIELHRAGVCCSVAGITRTPARRRVTLGTALAPAHQGVPTFVADQTGA